MYKGGGMMRGLRLGVDLELSHVGEGQASGGSMIKASSAGQQGFVGSRAAGRRNSSQRSMFFKLGLKPCGATVINVTRKNNGVNITIFDPN